MLSSFSWSGRINRSQYGDSLFWLIVYWFTYAVFFHLALFVIQMFSPDFEVTNVWMASLIMLIIFSLFFEYVAFSIRRLHDMGKSAYWFWGIFLLCVILIAWASSVFFIEIEFVVSVVSITVYTGNIGAFFALLFSAIVLSSVPGVKK
ncbi:hypothetical protein COB57_00445 [Candidatus Peregrinibacteria bacterium]|nr:MAG: hypothetical protein COB57_00445 [Candidatus Peregrinibacteria bacterium]